MTLRQYGKGARSLHAPRPRYRSQLTLAYTPSRPRGIAGPPRAARPTVGRRALRRDAPLSFAGEPISGSTHRIGLLDRGHIALCVYPFATAHRIQARFCCGRAESETRQTYDKNPGNSEENLAKSCAVAEPPRPAAPQPAGREGGLAGAPAAMTHARYATNGPMDPAARAFPCAAACGPASVASPDGGRPTRPPCVPPARSSMSATKGLDGVFPPKDSADVLETGRRPRHRANSRLGSDIEPDGIVR